MSQDKGELVCKQVSDEAVFFLDTRQFDLTIAKYDERLANAFLVGGHYDPKDHPELTERHYPAESPK